MLTCVNAPLFRERIRYAPSCGARADVTIWKLTPTPSEASLNDCAVVPVGDVGGSMIVTFGDGDEYADEPEALTALAR